MGGREIITERRKIKAIDEFIKLRGF